MDRYSPKPDSQGLGLRITASAHAPSKTDVTLIRRALDERILAT